MTPSIIGPSFQLFSSWCSLGCASCGIKTASPPSDTHVFFLDEGLISNAERNIEAIKMALSMRGYDYVLVEQSGGEPSHLPQIVELVGRHFEGCIHKIITNGLTTDALFDILERRQDQVVLVFSIEHNDVHKNHLRFGELLCKHPDTAKALHDRIMANLDLYLRNGFHVVVSTIISHYSICDYLDFLHWLETEYGFAVESGRLTPIPVSLVSFGDPDVGSLNPSKEQVDAFEERIEHSSLVTVRRAKEWLFHQLVGHYRNKYRYFHDGESLDSIRETSSKWTCDVFRWMVSFNFPDEEIVNETAHAIYEGYSCGVKVLGNVGYKLAEAPTERRRAMICPGRPCNVSEGRRYYGIPQTLEYLDHHSALSQAGKDFEQEVEGSENTFSAIRKGMCLLDDFDGVWWPFNVVLNGYVDIEEVGEYWSLLRRPEVVRHLSVIKKEHTQVSSGQ